MMFVFYWKEGTTESVQTYNTGDECAAAVVKSTVQAMQSGQVCVSKIWTLDGVAESWNPLELRFGNNSKMLYVSIVGYGYTFGKASYAL